MEMQSEKLDLLFTALAKAQKSLKPAYKGKKNPFFKSSYADLEEIANVSREALADNGLSVVQALSPETTGLCLVTTLGHSSGQWIKSLIPVYCKKLEDAQALGSAITYARRYALSAMVGVVFSDDPCDDDGESAKKADIISTSLSPKALDLKKRFEKFGEKAVSWAEKYLEDQEIPNWAAMPIDAYAYLEKVVIKKEQESDKLFPKEVA